MATDDDLYRQPLIDARRKPVKSTLYTHIPYYLGALFIFIFAWCAHGLPTIATDWAKRCDESCFPNKDTCKCECYDGIAKGPYGRGGYKYIYFNMEKQTYFIFVLFAAYIIMGQRAIESAAKLLFSGRLSIVAFLAFAGSVFPNYYSMNAHFNYINDNIHHLHAHQTYFTITELISTYCILRTADKTQMEDASLNKYLWVGFTVSISHLGQALKDNIIANVFTSPEKAYHHLVGVRDTVLLICELLILMHYVYRLNVLPNLKHILLRDGTSKNLDSFKRNLFVSLVIMGVTMVFLSNVTFGG